MALSVLSLPTGGGGNFAGKEEAVAVTGSWKSYRRRRRVWWMPWLPLMEAMRWWS